jgi:hypothetical protein
MSPRTSPSSFFGERAVKSRPMTQGMSVSNIDDSQCDDSSQEVTTKCLRFFVYDICLWDSQERKLQDSKQRGSQSISKSTRTSFSSSSPSSFFGDRAAKSRPVTQWMSASNIDDSQRDHSSQEVTTKSLCK